MLVSVLGLVRERVRRRELHLAFDAPPDIGWIQADESRLKQVLFHLLSNAIAFFRRAAACAYWPRARATRWFSRWPTPASAFRSRIRRACSFRSKKSSPFASASAARSPG